MRYINTDEKNMDFLQLSAELDNYLKKLAGDETDSIHYTDYGKQDTSHAVIIAYDKGRPVGCVAIRHFEGRTAEIRLFFVREAYRGSGVGRQLIEKLEIVAKRLRYSKLVLETGRPHADTEGFFAHIGYVAVPNYGPYADDDNYTCMGKSL